MNTIKDVKAKFPKAYSCCGELIATIDGNPVVLADLGNGGFTLTKEGQRLMGAVPANEAPKAPKEPKTTKSAKAKPEPAQVAPDPVQEPEETLDTNLGE